MSYRKINVDGKVYLYTIGKKFIKIRDVGLFLVKEHGNPVMLLDYHSENISESVKKVVSPATIRALIKGEATPVEVAPNEHRLMICPYDNIVHQKVNYVPFSKDSYNKSYENT